MTYDDLIKDIKKSQAYGGILYVVGNGGSASQADHLAGELIPSGIRCIPLNFYPVTSAIGNDYDNGFNKALAMQVLCLGREIDVLLCLTTSNKSKNIRNAQLAGLTRKMKVYTMTGRNAPATAGKIIRVGATDTQNVQEETLMLLHDLWKDLV